jgi:TatD DNase family protein
VIEVRMMKFHDAHCHLASKDFLKEFDIPDSMDNWKEAGLEYVIGVSTKLSESQKILEISRSHNEIIPGIGIHPWKAKRPMDEHLKNEFVKIVKENKRIVIGEIGLDHHFVKIEERYKFQEEYFRFFLELAEGNRLPVNIHLKGAEKEVSEILTSYNIPPENTLIHWFSGPKNVLNQLLEREYFFTINPSILTGSTHIEVLKNISLNRMLTESDGNVKYTIDNERISGSPEIIPKVIKKITEIKSIQLEVLVKILQENFRVYTKIEGN